MQDVQKLDDRRVVQLLQEANLPQLEARYALVWVLDLDLLERDGLKKHKDDSNMNDEMNSNCKHHF